MSWSGPKKSFISFFPLFWITQGRGFRVCWTIEPFFLFSSLQWNESTTMGLILILILIPKTVYCIQISEIFHLSPSISHAGSCGVHIIIKYGVLIGRFYYNRCIGIIDDFWYIYGKCKPFIIYDTSHGKYYCLNCHLSYQYQLADFCISYEYQSVGVWSGGGETCWKWVWWVSF